MIETLRTAFAVVLNLGILIIVHELGHFLVAKYVGIYVETFSIGFGPTLYSFKRAETEYRLAAFPIGGYVKMAGQEDLPSEIENEEENAQHVPDDKKFFNKTLLEKAAVVAAGPLMNFALGLVLMAGIYMVGVEMLTSHIGQVLPESAAAAAALEGGDRIMAVNGEKTETWEEMSALIKANPGREIELTILRGESEIIVPIVPQENTFVTVFNETQKEGRIGISPGENPQFITRYYNPISAFAKAFGDVGRTTGSIFKGLWKMVSGQIKADIAGPVGIIKMTGEQAAHGLKTLLYFMAVFSINLGVLNLLPVPVLDGGHLMFLAVEKIIGRKITLKTREIAQNIGMVLLLTLFAFATYKDLIKIF